MASISAVDGMPDALKSSRYHMKASFASFTEKGKRLMKKEEIEKTIEEKFERSKGLEGTLGDILSSAQEGAVVPPHVAFAVRHHPGFWDYYKVHAANLTVDGITAKEYQGKIAIICFFFVMYCMLARGSSPPKWLTNTFNQSTWPPVGYGMLQIL